jgi:uncharacterized protein (TIGR02246 family)
MQARILITPALLVAIACPGPERTAAVGDPAADRTQIEQLRDQWRAAADRDDAAGIAALYADGATFVGPGVPERSGRNAIQQAFAEQFPITSVTRIDSRDLQMSGDIAYDYGEFTQQVTPPGAQQQTLNGFYLVTLRREADGNWRIVRHISTVPDMPAQPAPGQPATPPGQPGTTARPPGAAPQPGPPAAQPPVTPQPQQPAPNQQQGATPYP